ncbi:MAG: GPP34 family phosphoprotein [Planctomycetota bacterium]|nr:MAG: GPP34 family phosphoprotein [Planctomycetota bacterium]
MDPITLSHRVALLGFDPKKGRLIGYSKIAIAGACLAELFLLERLKLDRKGRVEIRGKGRTGQSHLDACLDVIGKGKRALPASRLVSHLAYRAKPDRILFQEFEDRGLVRPEKRRFLGLFPYQVWSERKAEPRLQVLQSIRDCLYGSTKEVDTETSLLISLAKGAQLLTRVVDRKELKKLKPRLESITQGEFLGKAAQEAVQAIQTAAMVASITSATVATTATH